MIIEHQLGYPDVGVGTLDEFSTTALLSMAQSRQLTQGRDTTTAQVVNKAGKTLYLGNYATRLTVPASRLLSSARAWDRLSIGTSAKSYGNMLFELHSVLARPGEIEDRPESWDAKQLPTMHASAAFWIEDDGRDPEMSLPRAELIAQLPTMGAPPESMKRFRAIRSEGARPDFPPNVADAVSVDYRLLAGRDSAPGHAVTCSQLVRVVDAAQRELLTDHARVPFPSVVTDALTVLESETYLVGRCYGGETVRVELSMALTPWGDTLGRTPDDVLGVAVLDTCAEVVVKHTANLVMVSRTKKVVAVPTVAQRAVKDTERLLRRYTS